MFEQLIWLVPVVVAACGAWRPRAGLVVLTATLPLFGSPPGGPYLGALDVAALAAILATWRSSPNRPSPLTWPVIAFAATGLASLIPLPFLPPSWQPSILLGLVKALPGVESWTALYTWRAAVNLILGVGLFTAVRRAFDGSSLRPLAIAFLAGLGTTLLLGMASFANIVDLSEYRPLRTTRLAVRRMSSLFFLSGWFSQYLVFAAPLALLPAVRSKSRLRHLALPALAFVVACLLLTKQRGAWIAASVQLLFLAAVAIRRWRVRPDLWIKASTAALGTAALGAVLVIGSGSGLGSMVERVRSIPNGLAGRAHLWSTATEMVEARPLLGWGIGSFSPAYDLLHPIGAVGAHPFRGSAHSLYLQIAAERGLLGLLALALVGGTVALCLLKPKSDNDIFALAVATGLTGAVVYGLVQHLFYLKNIGWMLWILLGCAAAVTKLDRAPRLRRAGQLIALVAVLTIPVRLAVSAVPSYATARSFGFHQTEAHEAGTYRWTGRFAAERLPWEGETLVLSLANGHPRAAQRPVSVTIGLEGREVARLSVAGGWEEHRIQVGPPTRPTVVLTIEAAPTFRPFSDYRDYPDLQRSTDIRSLGIAVKNIHWLQESDEPQQKPSS